MKSERQGYRTSKHMQERPTPPMPFDPETATAQEYLDESRKAIEAGHAIMAEAFARMALKHPRLSQAEFALCHLLLAKALLSQGSMTAGDHAAQAARIASRSGRIDLAREAQDVQRHFDRTFYDL